MLFHFYLLVIALLLPMLALFAVRGRRELLVRGMTLLVILHIVLLAVASGSHGFRLLLLVLAGLGGFELGRAFYRSQRAAVVAAAASVLLLLLALACGLPAGGTAMVVPVLAALLFARPSLLQQRPAGPCLALSLLLAALLTLDHVYQASLAAVLFLLLLVQFNDNASLLAGKTLGRRRPFARLSPNKSLEGYLAGAAGMALAILLFTTVFPLLQSIRHALLLPLLWLAAVVLVNAGDLLFSQIKRQCGIKDFGRLLPGHGGVLDRFDSLLLAAPLGLLVIRLSG